MKTRMFLRHGKTIAAFLGLLTILATVPAQGEVVFRATLPWTVVVSHPGLPEPLRLSGSIEVLVVETTDANGGVHFKSQNRPTDVQVIGEISGAPYAYNAVGLTQNLHNSDADGIGRAIFVNNFYLIGEGGLPSFKVHQNLHLIVDFNLPPTDPNSVIDVILNNVKITCK